jgi:hypothetical protein
MNEYLLTLCRMPQPIRHAATTLICRTTGATTRKREGFIPWLACEVWHHAWSQQPGKPTGLQAIKQAVNKF